MGMRELSEASRLMTTGGDERLVLRDGTGLNKYHSAPRPSAVLAYASSTANDISAAAQAHVDGVVAELGGELDGAGYQAPLEGLRARLRRAYALPDQVDIVFAPSGTDLEYVCLAAVAGRGAAGTHNVLLGADEVGTGCIYSAFGRYFAATTALGIATGAGTPVPGFGDTKVELVDVPVRDPAGQVHPSAEIAARMDAAIAGAAAAGRHVLVHVVHGSKTGLILPSREDIDALASRHGAAATFVVDACQARIAAPAIAEYLERGAIVFVTGSKFMGGPPFSGFAFLPAGFRARAEPLTEGLATIFRRAEWPPGWRGADRLEHGANLGLLLRLEASLFELERFQRLGVDEVTRIILAFHQAVRDEIVDRTPARRVAPYPPGEKETAETHPIEMRTLSTLDLTGFAAGGASFEDATRWHQAMLAYGVRLGQPVKCVRLPDGRWGATLRIGLSMPQVVEREGLDDETLARSLSADMARVRQALESVAGV
ncbi:MAG: hypothetical protein QOE79_478 [Sphingomonadales bacterium]|jgi:hypothetical protein|nr:hypothetical protein [Sphingomonadales bacterium]